MFLPDATAQGVAEDATGGDPDNGQGIDPARAEVLWCAYAWPSAFGNSGKRTFFINQSGDVLASKNNTTQYNGTTTPPGFDAAFVGSGTIDMAANVAANTVGGDGEVWTVVN
jgi:hypothetical protein